MSDLQACLASFAVASGAQTENTAATVDRTIEAYLAGTSENHLQAMEALKTAFEAMMLDGRIASHISSRIDQALCSQLRLHAGDANGRGRRCGLD